MTIHAAKGLEYPAVFVVGMEENLFPSQLSLNSREELEEERRLFYVAITRAEKYLTLSSATTRYRWGQITHAEPSRFLEEIDPSLLDIPVASEPKGFLDFSSDRSDFGGFTPRNTSNAFKTKSTTPQELNPIQPKKGFTPLKKINPDAQPIVNAKSTFVADDVSKLQTGMEVVHERFGPGKVLNIEGRSGELKATIFFQEVGQKQLLLKFARLKIKE
jgi:DNA helicase-2/ATP-dependent DNA helicase PcrA